MSSKTKSYAAAVDKTKGEEEEALAQVKAFEEEEKILREQLEALRKENEEFKKNDTLKFHITERKQVGIVFGTYVSKLFKSQWLKILENEQEVRNFIKENQKMLA